MTGTVSVADQNAMNRSMLLATGISMIKKIPQQQGVLGSSIQIPLLRMGIATGVLLDIQIPVNVTATATLSECGPFNLVQNVKYTDFAGVDRVNTSGWALWALNSFKHREVMGSAVPFAPLPAFGAKDTAILSAPTATGAGVLRFQMMVPFAYEPSSDLRGAILAQTVVGEHYITLQLANALGGSDSWTSPYVGGTVAATGPAIVQAFQMYIQQQSSQAALLPFIDLSTIYAIEGNYVDSANITAGQAKYLNYPNNRSIMSSLFYFDNGGIGTPNGTDINQITLIANANTNLRELTPPVLRGMQRSILGADLANGAYYMGSRRQPITTQLFGNVQTKIDINTVAGAGAVQIVSQYESFYPSGAPLPGIQTS